MNYAHYAPPGAQILLHQSAVRARPRFPRDAGLAITPGARPRLFGTGWPSNAGGRLVGSLAGLPYALAEAEQNFLIPSQTQALIWGDLVPQMILSAKDSALVERHARPRCTGSACTCVSAEVLAEVGCSIRHVARTGSGDILSTQAPACPSPSWSHDLLEEGDVSGAVEKVTPSEMFVDRRGYAGSARKYDSRTPRMRDAPASPPRPPTEVNYAAISRAFGTPKPTLANSYQPELLNLRTFPTLMGYSSRIMAESWESNMLYWAALADEMHRAAFAAECA